MKFLDLNGLGKLWEKIRTNFMPKASFLSFYEEYDTFGREMAGRVIALENNMPTKTSQLENDSGFLTSHQSLDNYYTKTEVDTAITTAINNITDGDEVSY